MITNEILNQQGGLFPSAVVSYHKEDNRLYFKTANKVVMQVTIVKEDILRFRYTTTGVFSKDFSYAVSSNATEGYKNIVVEEEVDKYIIATQKLRCVVFKSNLKRAIYTTDSNELLCEDAEGFHWEEPYELGGDLVKMNFKSLYRENYYGLGDKPVENNLKGKKFENWASDSYAYERGTDPLYKAIPFYTALHNGNSYGIFFDNTFKTHFDFTRNIINNHKFWAEGGEMNYYFIHGPEMKEVVAKYTLLTGAPKDLPPLWALGFHQCKFSYYPQSEVEEITAQFRKHKIPCDAIYLDIDYMDGFRCFTWDKKHFPDLKKMVGNLKEQGFKTIAIIDPGIKVDDAYQIFNEGLEKDFFCRRADGPHMKGKVWPGECYFPDFTNPEVRTWWSGLFKELIEEVGISGIWNDMNEPAVFDNASKQFPLDVRHNYDGNPCSHRKAHNIYGMQMARATYHGVKKFMQPARPFVITRSAYTGAQRYASTWTGDNMATWDHLSIANQQMQRMCLSGYSFAGSDIGGFTEHPTGELFARWIQLGVFHPFCRVHSDGDFGDQEPWFFGRKITDIVRKFIELRYQLVPYLYTAFWKYVKDGVPILKSLILFDQQDLHTHQSNDEFIFGDQFLVCPVLEPNAKGRRMYFPKGRWYDYWTYKLYEGGEEHWVPADLDSMPLFVKQGAVIPTYPVQQYVGEKVIEEVYLSVFFKLGEETSLLYEDAGDGYDYENGKFNLRKFKLTGARDSLQIEQTIEGDFSSSYKQFKVKVHGMPLGLDCLEIDGKSVNIEEVDGVITFLVASEFNTFVFKN